MLVTTVEKPKRGKASRDAQLSSQQFTALKWLLAQEEEIQARGEKAEIKVLLANGVPWLAKKCFGPEVSRNSASCTLARLANRSMVECWDSTLGSGGKRNTTHVKLTAAGRHAAHYYREHGKSRRKVEDERRREYWYQEFYETLQNYLVREEMYGHLLSLSEYDRAMSLSEEPHENSHLEQDVLKEEIELSHLRGYLWDIADMIKKTDELENFVPRIEVPF